MGLVDCAAAGRIAAAQSNMARRTEVVLDITAVYDGMDNAGRWEIIVHLAEADRITVTP